MRKAVSVAVSLGGLILGGVVMAPTASAGSYGCSGSQIDSYPVRTGSGSLYGTIYLYYDAATGKNCAAMPATSAGGYGVSKSMTLSITECSEGDTNCRNPLENDYDQGSYKYYAGPVTVTAPNNCILVAGNIKYNGQTASGNSPISHCG